MKTRSLLRFMLSTSTAALLVAGVAPVASADHTDPTTPQSSIDGTPTPDFHTNGEGTWTFIRNFHANPGSDLKFFRKRRATYVASGTLGQASEEHVGQRIIKLAERDKLDIRWIQDHGSAACGTANPSGTLGLQHDSQVLPQKDPQILVDTTDATGRCHDPAGGGLELIDISNIHRPGFKAREIHLIRHAGTSHTVTTDLTRRIIYNSSSDFANRPWIDVVDARNCAGKKAFSRLSLAEKRDRCRPKVYRIPFRPEWSRQDRGNDGQTVAGSEAACHDITATRTRLYCAALNATIIFDVSKITNSKGAIRGTPLPCERIPGTNTGAAVTNCAVPDADKLDAGRALGWRYLGHVNHAGRDCVPGSANPVTNCNSNTIVPPDQDISVSHEADPLGNRWMFVTDERGGGVVPGGASCQPGLENPVGNGGIHVFDTSDPSDIQYAKTPDGSKAVWISEAQVPAPTFCTVHVIRKIPGENRLVMGYYSQGTKLLDYSIDANGRWTFQEVAGIQLPGAQTWAVEPFKIEDHKNGQRTYHFFASDIGRGVDVFKWTGPANLTSNPRNLAAEADDATRTDAGLLLGGLLGLPFAAWAGRRRRRSRH